MTTEIIATIIGGLGVLVIAGIFKKRKFVWSKMKNGHKWFKQQLRKRRARAEYIDLAISTHEAMGRIENCFNTIEDIYKAPTHDAKALKIKEFGEVLWEFEGARYRLGKKISRLVNDDWTGISGDIGHIINDEPEYPINERKRV